MGNGGDDQDKTGGDDIKIDEISGGTVAVGAHAQAIGTLIKQIEATNVAGDYVERQEISNTILIVGPDGLDQLTAWLAKQQGLNAQLLQQPGAQTPSPAADRQIAEVLAAQRQTAEKGIPTSPAAAYNLGMLAAYRREYDSALAYFQEAAAADPDYSDAFEAIAWLQQSQAMTNLLHDDYDGALDRLAQAREAAAHSDPLDMRALALRGFIAKTMAQIAAEQNDPAGSEKYYDEAQRLFAHILKLNPDDPSAHNGLANVAYARGDFDMAVTHSQRAVSLADYYTAAYKDLALAYEGKWGQDPDQAAHWCALAIAAWREAYRLAPDDPSFTADQILQIGKRIRKLEKYCP